MLSVTRLCSWVYENLNYSQKAFWLRWASDLVMLPIASGSTGARFRGFWSKQFILCRLLSFGGFRVSNPEP